MEAALKTVGKDSTDLESSGIHALLEELELREPESPKPGRIARFTINSRRLTIGFFLSALLLAIGGYLGLGTTTEPPSWLEVTTIGCGIVAALGIFLCMMGLLEELESPGAKLYTWEQAHKTRERKLYEILHSVSYVPQYEVVTSRNPETLKLQLKEKAYYSGEKVIKEMSLDSNTTVSQAAENKSAFQTEADEFQRAARLEYLKRNWKEWEDLILPYDPTAQHLKMLEEAIS